MKAAQVLSAHKLKKRKKKRKEKSVIQPAVQPLHGVPSRQQGDEGSRHGHNSESIDGEINRTNLPLDNSVSG